MIRSGVPFLSPVRRIGRWVRSRIGRWARSHAAVPGSAALGLTMGIFGAVGIMDSALGMEAVRSLLPFAVGT